MANLESRGILSIDGLRSIPEPELRELIRPSGFMLRKAAALKAFVTFLDTNYAGRLNDLREAAHRSTPTVRGELLTLPGVGPETADAILLYALSVPAMVVDEYLRRIVVRHGLAPENATYREIQALAEEAFAAHRDKRETLARHANEFHALVVQIGKLHCGRVPRCDGCPLRRDLPKSPARWRSA